MTRGEVLPGIAAGVLALLLIASPALVAAPATETRLTLKVVGVHDGDCIAGLTDDKEQNKFTWMK